jgi:hypothetical protein
VLLKYYLEKLGHNGISCHPTSTILEKPCDSQRLSEVIIKKRSFEVALNRLLS